ncbi:type VI secretion system amidase immunity protein Tai4 [Caballeronia sp. LZ065]|nr:type VI secretion system amidase immunity protein Tai4 [Caballeronia sp. LZ065]
MVLIGSPVAANSPEASQRTYAQNYRDMVLAACIATAYNSNEDARIDSGSSVSALRDWTYYDLDRTPQAITSLVKAYLDRDYHNPFAEAETNGLNIRFNLLKCLDLYHSKDLDHLVKAMVIDPNRRIHSPSR